MTSIYLVYTMSTVDFEWDAVNIKHLRRHKIAPAEAEVLALFYAAQRLAVTLELRDRPFIADLMAMRFSAREVDVLRAGLKGSADEQIAAWLGLSVDAIRYYFKKFKNRVPPVIGHLKPRDLARILHQLDRL